MGASDLPRTDVTLLYPFPGDEVPDVRSTRLTVTDALGAPVDGAAISIERPGGQDGYLMGPSAGLVRALGGAVSDGSLAWFTTVDKGVFPTYTVVGGSSLSAPDGKHLVQTTAAIERLSANVEGSTLYVETTSVPKKTALAAPQTVTRVIVSGEVVTFKRSGYKVWIS